MDGEGMKLWLKTVWSKRPSSLKKPSLLVCHQFKAHVTESTKGLATKLKMHLAVITGGLTSQLQPLGISVNPSAWSDEHCSSTRKRHLSWSDEHCSSAALSYSFDYISTT